LKLGWDVAEDGFDFLLGGQSAGVSQFFIFSKEVVELFSLISYASGEVRGFVIFDVWHRRRASSGDCSHGGG
jgi:hypothetical protein